MPKIAPYDPDKYEAEIQEIIANSKSLSEKDLALADIRTDGLGDNRCGVELTVVETLPSVAKRLAVLDDADKRKIVFPNGEDA